MPEYEQRIKDLGIVLPETPKPVAAYVPAKRVGNLVYCSGQGPILEGKITHTGKVGKERTIEEGYEAARICALNCIASICDLVGGLDSIEEIVQVRGFVNCVSDFTDHPAVINGASEILEKIFGDGGKHARCALGMSSLPSNITVEIEMIAKIKNK